MVFLQSLTGFWWIVPLVLLIVGYKLVLRIFGVVIIPESSIGIVNKKFVLVGDNATLPDGTIIALKGEAGWQADTLAPGIHYFKWPWQYEIKTEAMYVIPPGKIGVVNAKDGKPIPTGRVLGKQVDCESFQNARLFLTNNGERGQQIGIIPPGTYRINTALFELALENIYEVSSDKVGIVTTRDGKPLPTGEIAGREIPEHNSFQDVQKFMDNGGFKGRQEQVIMAGKYFLNPYFASVEQVELTEVPIAHVGVVIAYVGDEGDDVSGVDFQHGNLVDKGKKGVCNEPLDPGRYAINKYTHKVVSVPTQNVVLNWANERSESHNLDKDLCSITVRSSDGFKFNLDVSQIIHIPRNYAPLVIAQFGNVENLVTQVLEPIIGNYFRNAAQGSDVIKFLTERQDRQNEAKAKIDEALKVYHVGAIDTLIGDITPPEELMTTLKDRQIAEQKKITFNIEREAEDQRKLLEQSKAMANTQKDVVTAERQVSIKKFEAEAAVEEATGEAGAKTKNAEADAKVLELVGNATAKKTLAIGEAEAKVIKQKIESIEPGNFATIEVAKALGSSGQKWVPEIVMTSGDGKSGGTIADVLIANLVKENLRPVKAVATNSEAVNVPALEDKKEVIVEEAVKSSTPKEDTSLVSDLPEQDTDVLTEKGGE